METNINIFTYIQSNYILKNIFDFLFNNKKLDIIIYNKEIQNKLGINLENYKLESDRYKIIDKNGNGKEYQLDTNILLFEDEYLKGKKNGKGKEYYDFKVILGYTSSSVNIGYPIKFEGEYLNGKRIKGIGYDEWGHKISKIENGKIEEYYSDGKTIKFIGEYINNKRWNGKGYDCNGKEIYEIKNGKGYIMDYDNFYSDRLRFEGKYENGEKNGFGK